MANASDTFSQFKAAIATPDVPSLGPERRPGALPVVELERRLNSFFATTPLASRTQPILRSAALWWHDHLDASHDFAEH
jgi:hypothetical protein